jgi:ubiquinone/menaquinone biosynthesis C-methylase UbiE
VETRPFSGDIVDYYARYRRGFPPAVVDALVAALGLGSDDVAVDLGCGTGQLALPLAGRVRAVVGMDPEPDMLDRAREIAAGNGATNVGWLLGADHDLPALAALLGDGAVGAVTIATAIHFMRYEELFRAAVPLLRPGGGIAVIANGKPLWLLETDWSRTLRRCLSEWSGREMTSHCGTDEKSRARYREALTAAGYDVHETVVEYEAELTVEQLIGNVFSSAGSRLPEPDLRSALADRIREALQPQLRFTEPVRVAALIGHRPP